MLNRRHTLVVCLAFASLPFFLFAEEPAQQSLQFYDQGLQFAQRGEIQLAVESFKKAVEQDSRFADAYHQLALMYIQAGTIESRADASRMLKRAIGLDEHNVRYQLDMGRLLLKRELNQSARSQFRKVIEMDSTNAEAYLQLALLRLEEMRRHKDLIKPLGPTVVTYTEDAEAGLRDAKALLHKAIQFEPAFADPYYHLAVLSYEERDYSGMLKYLDHAIAADSTNKNFYLFKGLALQKIGEFESAFSAYESALQVMSPEERALFFSVEPLLNKQEISVVEGLDPAERAQYQHAFWIQKDPIFLTEYNERLMAHFGRLAYVNLRFTKPEAGWDGWGSDRAQTYLRFGPPNRSFRTRSSIELTFGGNPIRPAEEHWIYDKFTLAYEDLYLSGKYNFKRHFQPDADSKLLYERLIEDMPDRYVLERPIQTWEIPAVIAQFKGHAGKTRIELNFGIPISFGPGGPLNLDLHVKCGWFVFDDKWRQVLRRVEKPRYSQLDLSEQNGGRFIVDKTISEVWPGIYNVGLELLDDEAEQFGRLTRQLHVQRFGSDSLEMSDVVVAQALRTNTALVNSNAGEVRAVPSFSRVFTRGQEMLVYFEIYNLTLDDNGDSSYRIASGLKPDKRSKNRLQNFASSIAGLFGTGNQDEFTVSTSFDYVGQAPTERSYHAMQVEKMPAGSYVLRIEVTDVQTAQTVHRDTPFQIVD